MRSRSGCVHDMRPSELINPMVRACLAAWVRWMSPSSASTNGGGEIAGAAVEVVIAAHRTVGEPLVGVVWEAVGDEVAEVVPDDWVGEFGFDLAR